MFRALSRTLLLAGALAATPAAAQLQMTEEETTRASYEALFEAPMISSGAIARLRARGKQDVLPTLALVVRYRGGDRDILDAISSLAGEPLPGWHQLMLWLEARPDIRPHPSYRLIKLDMFGRVDPNFLRFLGGERAKAENMDIRLEEVVWGGVRVDGIPSLDNPKMLTAAEADYLKDDDLVFGVSINGDDRAYPIRVLAWHEMMNDVVGGVPVALAYCTLCGAGILFETEIEGREKALIFGSSGMLYRSNKLMFDRETDSLWNQFTGRPVSGPLRGQNIELKLRPVAITTWGQWRARRPNTTVLSLETGHHRDYGSGVAYRDYFASPNLMFPTLVADESVAKRKDFVYGLKTVGAARAWPVAAFAETPVINDAVGGQAVVLIGDAKSRTVRAYARDGHSFAAAGKDKLRAEDGGEWRATETELVGPNGKVLPRLAGRLSYWFAWSGYYGVESSLYGEDSVSKNATKSAASPGDK